MFKFNESHKSTLGLFRGVFVIVQVFALVACTNHPRQAKFTLVFTDEHESPVSVGTVYNLSEVRGRIHATPITIGGLVVCEAGRVELIGEFRFPLLVSGVGVFHIIHYDEVAYGGDYAVPHGNFIGLNDDHDLGQINSC